MDRAGEINFDAAATAGFTAAFGLGLRTFTAAAPVFGNDTFFFNTSGEADVATVATPATTDMGASDNGPVTGAVVLAATALSSTLTALPASSSAALRNLHHADNQLSR